MHHLFSDIEHHTFLIYDFHDGVRDIREQFPLDLDQTRCIAKSACIRHPVDSKSCVDLGQTTNLVKYPERNGKVFTIARTIKPVDALCDLSFIR